MNNDEAITHSEADQADSVADKPTSKRSGCVFGCLFGGLIFYFLSPPFAVVLMVKLADWGWMSGAEALQKIIGIVYFPVHLLYQNVQPVRAFYDWYGGLFDHWLTR